MSNLVALFGNTALSVPSYLAASDDSATNQLLGGLGGDGRNRIGLKGARFRLIQAGQEVAIKDEPYLDVHIIAANPAISRTFYMGKYDPTVKVPPACWSADGVAPSKDVQTPQSSKCATCKQNEKGSKIYDDGKKGRACTYSKRMAVTLVGDETQTVYQMDVKALSIFGDGNASKGLYTLAEYAKLLASRGVRTEGVVTRISFDTDSSVPKLFFTPHAFVSEADFAAITKLSKSQEVLSLIEISAESVNLSQETDLPEPFETQPPATPAPAPAPAAKPATKPSAKAAEALAPAPVVAQPASEDLESLLADLV